MKYIIELEDEPYMREDGVNYYTCKSARWYKLGETIINRLTPYTDPDRKAIEDEVWELVKVIEKMEYDDYEKCFSNYGGHEAFFDRPYREAKAKYDAWKKSKEEVHVGDEVKIANTIGVVTRVPEYDEQRVHYIAESGTVYCNNAYADIVKTGRHFDEVESLLKKMEED